MELYDFDFCFENIYPLFRTIRDVSQFLGIVRKDNKV